MSTDTERLVIVITLERAERGWVVSTPQATAQGKSRADALANLLDLLRSYPDLL